MERNPAVEGPRLSFATTAEDVGFRKPIAFQVLSQLTKHRQGNRAAGSRESLRYRKAYTVEGFLLNHIGLERRAEYFISIKFEGSREIHYKYKHSLELYIGQFFLF